MGVGDDRCVDVGVAVEVELLERHRDPVVWVEVVEPAADVGARGHSGELE
jgi:hypothetical protein